MMNSTVEPYVNIGTAHSASNDEDDLPVDYVQSIIFTYVAPCLIFSGTVGNLLSLIVLLSRHFKNAPSAFILSALALTDIGVLGCGLMRHWILSLTESGVDIRTLSSASCKVHTFFTYLLPQLSAWSLVLLTCERFVSVKWPLEARQLLSKPRMASAWAITLLVLAVLNSHFFITVDLEPVGVESDDGTVTGLVFCSPVKWKHFFTVIWPWLDLVVLSMLPTAAILPLNTAVALELVRADRRRTREMQAKRIDDSASITTMLIGIGVLFLLTTTPVSVYFIWVQYHGTDTRQQLFASATAYSVTNIVYYLNSSVNFLIYCISGSKFRRALVAVFRCTDTLPVTVNGTNKYNISRNRPDTREVEPDI